MCWRNNVQWAIHENDDPKQFMTVTSGEYVLAIPDYSHQARESALSGRDGASMSSSSTARNAAMFKKVVMKLSGNVRWMAGIVFERDLEEGKRSFEFIPHYKVTLRTPAKASAFQKQVSIHIGLECVHLNLTALRATMLSKDFAAITSTCRSQWRRLLIVIGRRRMPNRRLATTQYI